MTHSNFNLETLISKETLKKSLTGVIIVFVVLFIVSVIFVVYQNEKSHKKSITHLIEKLDGAILNFQQQVDNLAKNDLIINSIVDDQNRDNYLPIFFRSLKFNNSLNTSIVFTDYTGEVITGKNTALHQTYATKFNWQETVLNTGLPFFHFSTDGIFAAAPVLLSTSAEGAIVAYIADLQKLIPLPDSNTTFIYTNNKNKVLYSSNEKLIPHKSIFNENSFLFWSKNKQPYLAGHIISIEPPLSAYGNIIWLAIIIIVSLIFILFGLMLNVKSTAKYASHSMQQLQKTLAEAITQSGNNVTLVQSDKEPIEFIAIRKEFNTVLMHLFNQTISLKKFSSVINSLDEILFVLDKQQNVILSNSSFNIFCENINTSIPQGIEQIIPEIKNLTTNTKYSHFEIEYPASNKNVQSLKNNLITVQWRASDYTDDKGEVLGITFVGKDISIAKQLEAELLIKNQAVDSAETSIIITDAQQSELPIIYANKSFCKLTGYSIGEVIGKNCRFLQGKNTQASDVTKIKTAIENQETITLTLSNYKKDGSEFKNELTINPISNEHGVVTHFLGIQLDVTEREATATYLKLAKQTAEESTQLKSEFLASMSHEIRTPMNGVIGMLDLLMMDGLNSKQYHHAEIAKDSAHSLLTIINDILDFSKIESGKLEIENTEFDLVSLFEHVAKAHAHHAHEKNVELIIDTTQINQSLVTGDSCRIRQILNNLISNAIKFTDKGNVTITAAFDKTSEQLGKLHCQVTDTGIGIDTNRLQQVFDSFTQADSSTTRLYGGTGLGLAITSKLCQLMNGSVNVTSKKSVGSSFNFDIQLGVGDQEEELVSFNLNNTKILLLENVTPSAEVLKKQLEKWGANVVIEKNKDNVINHLKNDSFDIALVDSGYANNSAFEIIKDLPVQYKNNVAFIFMAKVNENQDNDIMSSAGFRHYFSKPVTTESLILTFEKIFNKSVQIQQDIFNENLTTPSTNEELIPMLLVEDNPINQLVAKTLLLSLGAEVTIANNGKEAINLLNNSKMPFKLIFMDCQMPILDGYQATQRIRTGAAGEHNKTIPIIAMTANAMKGDKEKCLVFGMDDYISKPIDIDILQEKIALWLNNYSAKNH